MGQRTPRPLTPFGVWVKAQSILKGIELRTIAKKIGIWPQNLAAKMRGERPFSDQDIAQIEKIFGEKYSEHRSA
ncbi:hypothetical protein [Faecalispora anaeroviscerum]|uniref:hypothetical protein n=1 Tax=Faecalispora anaeroviscerum TaxID=2991836 RepID=UPI0024BB8AFA|nr:hypothetical protein [Faecalispora anaeroviscerum]